MDYLIVAEETSTGYSAYAPDLPGCVATAGTMDEVRSRMREAIGFHIKGLEAEGFPVPLPNAKAFFFDVGQEGAVQGERNVETIYEIMTFARKAGISPSTARAYAHRYKIGQKMGRGWVFTDADLEVLAGRRIRAK